MYGLYGVNEVVRNLHLFAIARGEGLTTPSIQDLRLGYLRVLNDYLPEMPINTEDNIFIFDEDVEAALVLAYSSREDNSLDDMRQSELISRQPVSPKLKMKHMQWISDILTDMGLEDNAFEFTFHLVIHSIFIRASNSIPGITKSFGGSSGGALGAIWFVPNTSLTRHDQMELLVHELAHHLLFIDEMVHPQFDYSKIALKQYYARSAILKKSRPLDKVAHSIVVGVEILLWRARTKLPDNVHRLVHPSTEDLVQQIFDSLDSLYSIPNLNLAIKPRMQDILNRCKMICENYSNKNLIQEEAF